MCGHLRQVGHAKHLALLAEPPQRFADRLRHRAAHACVDLVEHERGDRRGFRRHQLERQADARELAAGGDLGERPQGQAGMGSHFVLDIFGAHGARFLQLL